MTLNNVIDRIELICTSHHMIRTFDKGLPGDAMVDHTTKYAYAYLEDNGGSVSISGSGLATLSYRLKLMDLVNVSEDTKTNEQDVQSDMFSVMLDIVAQMSSSIYDDWKISTSNNVQLFVEEDNDMVAGVYLDFSVTIMFKQNLCEIPSDLVLVSGPGGSVMGTPQDFKLVYDYVYTSTGTEGSTLTPATLAGKKILFASRENMQIIKVSNLPNSSEFTWDGTDIVLGAPVNEIPGERFFFLYRNY